jgi:hypothetical protein
MKKFMEKIKEIKWKYAGKEEAKRLEDSKTGH